MTNWIVGQRAVIDRRLVVTIERVTPSGRVTAAGRTFNPDGFERGVVLYRASKLDLLTPEIEKDVAINALAFAINDAQQWSRNTFNRFVKDVPKIADIEKAERLTAAINRAMEPSE